MKRIRLIRYVWYVGYLALLLCASRVTAQTHTIRQFEAQRRAALREIEQTTQLLNIAQPPAPDIAAGDRTEKGDQSPQSGDRRARQADR